MLLTDEDKKYLQFIGDNILDNDETYQEILKKIKGKPCSCCNKLTTRTKFNSNLYVCLDCSH